MVVFLEEKSVSDEVLLAHEDYTEIKTNLCSFDQGTGAMSGSITTCVCGCVCVWAHLHRGELTVETGIVRLYKIIKKIKLSLNKSIIINDNYLSFYAQNIQ